MQPLIVKTASLSRYILYDATQFNDIIVSLQAMFNVEGKKFSS